MAIRKAKQMLGTGEKIQIQSLCSLSSWILLGISGLLLKYVVEGVYKRQTDDQKRRIASIQSMTK